MGVSGELCYHNSRPIHKQSAFADNSALATSAVTVCSHRFACPA